MAKLQVTQPMQLNANPRSPSRGQFSVLILAAVLVAGLALVYGFARTSRQAAPSYPPEAVAYGEVVLVGQTDNPTFSSSAPSSSAPEGEGSPVVDTPENYFNFGAISGSDVMVRTFALRNTGDAPLVIERAYTTCGCTTAEISARVIPPGKLALVQLRFDAGFHDVRGMTVRRGLVVETNDALHPRVEMWVQATVRAN